MAGMPRRARMPESGLACIATTPILKYNYSDNWTMSDIFLDLCGKVISIAQFFD